MNNNPPQQTPAELIDQLIAEYPPGLLGPELIDVNFFTTTDDPFNLQYYELDDDSNVQPISVGAVIILRGTWGGSLRLTGIADINTTTGWVLFHSRVIIEPRIPYTRVLLGLCYDSPMRRLPIPPPQYGSTPVNAYFAAPIALCAFPRTLVRALLAQNPFLLADEALRSRLRRFRAMNEAPPIPHTLIQPATPLHGNYDTPLTLTNRTSPGLFYNMPSSPPGLHTFAINAATGLRPDMLNEIPSPLLPPTPPKLEVRIEHDVLVCSDYENDDEPEHVDVEDGNSLTSA